MALEFPANPAAQTPVNVYGPNSTPDATTNGVTYTWNGSYWEADAAGDVDLSGFYNKTESDDRFVNVDGDTMTGDLIVPSLNGGPLAGFRNQIINGGFHFQQRSPGAGIDILDGETKYYSDRWMMIPGGTDITTGLSTGSGNLYQTITPATTGVGIFCYFVQAIELPPAFTSIVQSPFKNGSTWTLSGVSPNGLPTNVELTWSTGAAPRGEVATTQGVIVPTAGINTAWSATFTIDDTNFDRNTHNCLTVRILFNDLDGVESLGNVQLEPGPVATPFEHRPIGAELALCHRYCVVTENSTVILHAGNDTEGIAKYDFPVEMRTRPSISRGDGGAVNTTEISSFNGSADYGTLSSISVTRFGTQFCTFSRVRTESLARIKSLRFDAEL